MSTSEPAKSEATRWDVPAIDGSDGRGYLTAGRLQALQKDAYDEAFKRGRVEGIAAGNAEIQRRTQRLDELLRALSQPFDDLDGSVEKQLVELAIVMVKQMFRREIKIDPSHIVGVAREAIRTLPISSRNVCLHLHPDDAELVRTTLRPADDEAAWRIVEDPLITAGGCTVVTDNSQVDASVESRLASVLRSVFEDDRNQ